VAKTSGVTTVTNLKEQGFHWEKATNWGSAMTCYYHAALILDEQGDGTGARMLLTSAYQMLCRMKVEADVPLPDLMASCSKGDGTYKSFSSASTEELARKLAHLNNLNAEDSKSLAADLLVILTPSEAGLTFSNVHKVFEGDTTLLQTGLAVTVKLAQSLLTAGMAGVSWNLMEQVLKVASILILEEDFALPARDAGTFQLRDQSVCFLAVSGMFLLLLLNEAKDDLRCSRRVATQELAIVMTRSNPSYEVHYVMALINRIKHLDHYIHVDSAAADQMFPVVKELMQLYSVEKHSKALVFHYGSDRVINALCCIFKMLHMQGRFAEAKPYAEYILKAMLKVKHFYSHYLGMVTFLPVWAMYHSNRTSKLLVDKLVRLEQRQRRKDLRPMLLVLQEWIGLIYRERSDRRAERRATYMTQGMTDAASAAVKACVTTSTDADGEGKEPVSPLSKAAAAAAAEATLEPEGVQSPLNGSKSPQNSTSSRLGISTAQGTASVAGKGSRLHSDSPEVEEIIRSRAFAQEKNPSRRTAIQRLFMVGVELAIASICLMKVEHLEKSPDAMKPNTQNSIVEYLNLGLEHLKFTPEDSATNETFLFSSVHEKLLRAKLLIKAGQYEAVAEKQSTNAGTDEGDKETLSDVHQEKRRELWSQAFEMVQTCVQIGHAHNFHAIVYQAGSLLKLLGRCGFVVSEALESGLDQSGCKKNDGNGKDSDEKVKTDEKEQEEEKRKKKNDEDCNLVRHAKALQHAALEELVKANGKDPFYMFLC
jgi:hypothetical protein